MTPVAYWPYDEITLNIEKDQVTVLSPWLTAKVDINDSNRAGILQLVEKFQNETLSAEDLPVVNWFFSKLSHVPLCYTLPTAKSADATDRPMVDDDKLNGLSLDGFLAFVCGDLVAAESNAFDGVSLSNFLDLSRSHWDWDADAALSFSRCGDGVHPESLLSVARRYHLIDLMADNKAKQCFDQVSLLTGDDFALASGLMVKQNHYVTQQCQWALAPSLSKAGLAHDLVEAFMKEELGHDRILGAALQSVTDGSSVGDLNATLQTRCLMQLLRFAATRNFLSFALVVDTFERSSLEDTDPLAKLLAHGGFEKAAKQVNRHKEINDAGEHENVASGLVRFMAPVASDYALEAMRIAEAVNLLMISVPGSAFDLFKLQKSKREK